MTSRQRAACAFAFVVSIAASAQAQTFFTEQFENMGNVPIGGWGPQGLITKGWIFQNNSQPLGTIGWVPGRRVSPALTRPARK